VVGGLGAHHCFEFPAHVLGSIDGEAMDAAEVPAEVVLDVTPFLSREFCHAASDCTRQGCVGWVSHD